MPDTRVTKQKWKDHWSYSKKIYIIGTLLAVAAVSLIFSVTRYVPPDEKSVKIGLVDSYIAPEKLDDTIPELLSRGQAFDETLEEVQFMSVNYSGTEDDYYGSQVYTVQLYAGENDAFIQNEALTLMLAEQGYCVPLETMEGFDEFTAAHPEVEVLWHDEPTEEDDWEEEKPPVPQHAYALSAAPLRGMAERGAFANSGKWVFLTVTGKNRETSFKVMTELYDVLKGTKPLENAAPEAEQAEMTEEGFGPADGETETDE